MEESNLKHTPEDIALNNVINKLQIYMEQTNQTLHGLATTMGFTYQPLYRLMTKKHLPTISSLGLIATHLKCNISELTSENIFIDINCYSDMAANFNTKSNTKCRAYIPYKEYSVLLQHSFFAVKDKNTNNKMTSNDNIYQLFYHVDSILMDGLFLVNYNSKKTLITVLSVSSKYIVIEEKNQEVKIDIKSIQPIAKFFSYLELTRDDNVKFIGVKL